MMNDADFSDEQDYSDDEQNSDDQDQDDQDQNDDSSDDSGGDSDDSDADSGAGSQTHRNFIGEALQHLSDRGIDVEGLAEKAGVSSTDVNNLTEDDLGQLTQYIQQNHPEAIQAVSDRFPAAQGILSALGGGGFLGKLFG
jgi:hypothetical protein